MQTAAEPHDPRYGSRKDGSADDNYTPDSIKLCPSIIKTWVEKHYFACTLPHHWSWDKSLWSKDYNVIVNFLEGRFRTTLDEVEYYKLMIYLRKLIPDSELYIPFKESPQYRHEIKGILPTSYITACKKGSRRANHPIGQANHTIRKAVRGGD